MAKYLFLLEDDSLQAAIIVNALEDAGYEVRREKDVRHAIGYLARQQMYGFDAILTDGQLGRGDEQTGLFFITTLVKMAPRYAALPFIGGSGDSTMWNGFAPEGVNFSRVDKTWCGSSVGWDVPAVLAKLKELGVTP